MHAGHLQVVTTEVRAVAVSSCSLSLYFIQLCISLSRFIDKPSNVVGHIEDIFHNLSRSARSSFNMYLAEALSVSAMGLINLPVCKDSIPCS